MWFRYSLIAFLVALAGPAAAKACPAPSAAGPIEFCGQTLARDAKKVTCNEVVPDLCPLAGLPALRELRAHDTKSFAGLELLVNLETLDVGGSHLTDYDALASLSRLKHLKLESSYITDLKPLAKLTDLETLDLSTTDSRSRSCPTSTRSPGSTTWRSSTSAIPASRA